MLFFFSSRRRHTRYWRDWSSDVCSSDLGKCAFVGLNELKEKHDVGANIRGIEKSQCEGDDNFPINLLFHSVNEINVMIETLEEAKRQMSGNKTGIVKRTERGWAGHFICAYRCAFRRNTLLEYKDQKIVVSTVGRMYDDKGKLDTVGHNRYYETMAFMSDSKDTKYYDIDVEKEIQLDCEWCLGDVNANDNKANDMHENAVRWISEQMVKDNIIIVQI